MAKDILLGTFNADNGRNNAQVVREFKGINKKWYPDALAVQEGVKYIRPLRRNLGAYRILLSNRRTRTARDSYLTVKKWRRGAKLKYSHQLNQGWERAPRNQHRGLHPPRVMNVYKLGWIDRLVVTHFPPTPRSRRRPHIDHSYPLRDAAWQEYLDKLDWLVTNWNKRRWRRGRRRPFRWVIAGDQNINASDPRIVRWAESVDAEIVGDGIDYFIVSRGVWSRWNTKHRHGRGDHGHVAFTKLRKVRF